MNVKLAWEIGRRLGMQKKAAPPATTKAFKSFPLPEDSESTPGSFLSAIVGPRGDIGGPRKDSYTLSGEAAGSLPKTEPAPEPWAGGGTAAKQKADATVGAKAGPLSLGGGTAAKQKADATVGAKAGPLSLGGATSSGATPSLNDSDDWDEKSPLSLNDSDDWDEKSPLSLDSVGGSAAQGGQATHLRNMQLYGVDAANRMKAGGGQQGQATHLRNMQLYGVDAANRMKAGGGQQRQENNFWSSVPSPANSRQTTADMYNRFLGFNSPTEYSGWRDAQTSGLGRALKARSDNQFVRMMLGDM